MQINDTVSGVLFLAVSKFIFGHLDLGNKVSATCDLYLSKVQAYACNPNIAVQMCSTNIMTQTRSQNCRN